MIVIMAKQAQNILKKNKSLYKYKIFQTNQNFYCHLHTINLHGPEVKVTNYCIDRLPKYLYLGSTVQSNVCFKANTGKINC